MFAEYTQGKNIKVLPLVLSLVESTACALPTKKPLGIARALPSLKMLGMPSVFEWACPVSRNRLTGVQFWHRMRGKM